MSARDKIHYAVKNALIHDGWTITHDPYTIEFENEFLYADLAAERIIAATRGRENIIVGGHYRMDKLETYRSLVMTILKKHANLTHRPQAGVESHAIFDQNHDRYMMFRIGWRERKRVHTPFVYIHFKNNKIWIEEDWTEDGIATELLDANVPREDIVLAFHHPEKRPYTEFAVA